MIGIAGLAAISAAGALAPAVSTPFVCQAVIQRRDHQRVLGWVNLLLDAQYNPVRRELYIRTDQIDASWRLDSAPAEETSLQHFHYRLLLPEDTRFPVQVQVSSGGRSVWSGTVPTPTGAVMVLDGAERRLVPGILFAAGAGGMLPDPFGLAPIHVTVRGVDGAAVLEQELDLPEWSYVSEQMALALRRAHIQHQERLCDPSVVP